MPNRNNTFFTALTIAAVLCLTSAAALAAGRDVDETRKVDPDARISVETTAGLVEVVGWDRAEVAITGTLDEKADRLEIEGGGRSLHIEVKYPRKRNLNIREGSRLYLKVPHGCDLQVETVSSDVNIEGVQGEVAIETVSGEAVVRGKPSDLEIETVSGVIDVAVETRAVALATVSGDIRARDLGEEVSVSTVSGSIEIDASYPLHELEAESVSGDIEITAAAAKGASWDISCHSGDIDLEVPADTDAVFDIETFSGDIRDGFGHDARRTSKYAPGRELKFTQGSGSADISIEAFSGDVTIKRR